MKIKNERKIMNIILTEEETKELILKIKPIIKSIPYITLSTTDLDHNPCASPVNSAYDEDFNFYWKSPIETQHSQNILVNNKIFWVLFDTNAKVGTGIGIYFKGKAYQLEEDNIEDVKKGNDLIARRVGKIGSFVMKFLKMSPRRVYKAIPEEIWINTLRMDGIHVLDGKVKITLEQLKKYI